MLAADDFSNSYNATINADNFNVTTALFYNRDSSNNDVLDNFNVTVTYTTLLWWVLQWRIQPATINANDFYVTVADDFPTIFIYKLTSMLPQQTTFTIRMVQQSMQITSMLQQETPQLFQDYYATIKCG